MREEIDEYPLQSYKFVTKPVFVFDQVRQSLIPYPCFDNVKIDAKREAQSFIDIINLQFKRTMENASWTVVHFIQFFLEFPHDIHWIYL